MEASSLTVACMLVSYFAYSASAENEIVEQYLPIRGYSEGYPSGGDDCPFTPCCKEKAMSAVSECYTLGPLLSALLSIALFVKLTYSSAATVCTTTTLEMSTTTGTVEKFITVTSVSTVVSTSLQVFPVTSVLLATAVLARTFEQLETAPLVYTTITVTSAVISTSVVATVQIDESRCKYKNGRRDLEEFGYTSSGAELSNEITYGNETIATTQERSQSKHAKVQEVDEGSWFPYLENSGRLFSPVATRTPLLWSNTNEVQPSFRF